MITAYHSISQPSQLSFVIHRKDLRQCHNAILAKSATRPEGSHIFEGGSSGILTGWKNSLLLARWLALLCHFSHGLENLRKNWVRVQTPPAEDVLPRSCRGHAGRPAVEKYMGSHRAKSIFIFIGSVHQDHAVSLWYFSAHIVDLANLSSTSKHCLPSPLGSPYPPQWHPPGQIAATGSWRTSSNSNSSRSFVDCRGLKMLTGSSYGLPKNNQNNQKTFTNSPKKLAFFHTWHPSISFCFALPTWSQRSCIAKAVAPLPKMSSTTSTSGRRLAGALSKSGETHRRKSFTKMFEKCYAAFKKVEFVEIQLFIGL